VGCALPENSMKRFNEITAEGNPEFATTPKMMSMLDLNVDARAGWCILFETNFSKCKYLPTQKNHDTERLAEFLPCRPQWRSLTDMNFNKLNRNCARWDLVDKSQTCAPLEIEMRLQFKNTVRVKKLAKSLADKSELKHGQALDVVSQLCGCLNYNELQNLIDSQSDKILPDIVLSVQQRATLIGKLVTEAKINAGDAIDILENSRLLGNKSIGMKELIAVRTELFSLEYQKISGKRVKGEVGKVRNLMSRESVAILRKFDRPTRVITHKSANSSVADFEYTSPRIQLPFFIPMRLYLPYGHWIEKDGSWVLFSRDYFPLWRISKPHAPERLDPSERINFDSSNYYWGEHRVPWSDKALYDDLIEELENHGIRSLPRSVEILKLILEDDSIADFKDAVPPYSQKAA
jgi:hypothetical protein